MKNLIKEVLKGSIAEEMEIEVGDYLLSVNGQEIHDIIDYRFLTADEELLLEIEKKDEEASLERIAEEMHVQLSEVVYALDAISDTVSLYDPVYNKSGDTLMLMDQLGDEKNTDEIWTEKVALDNAVSHLSGREKRIIYLRYYEGKTQTEISEEVGISQAQVSRLEKSAIAHMKKYM